MGKSIPVDLKDADFEARVLKSPKLVVLTFWAPWDGPSGILAPLLDQLAVEYDGRVVVAKMNTDEESEVAIKYGVQGLPTTIFFKNGREVNRMIGKRSDISDLRSRVNAMFAVPD